MSSAATPDLPALSPQQLIAKVQQSDVKAFSGTVRLTTDLGIPNVGSLQETGDSSGGGFNPATLLSGAHEAHVKVAGPDRQAHDLLEATTRISNGMLLQTKLVNAILLDDGRLVVGLVKPAALEAAVSNG